MMHMLCRNISMSPALVLQPKVVEDYLNVSTISSLTVAVREEIAAGQGEKWLALMDLFPLCFLLDQQLHGEGASKSIPCHHPK